MILHIHEYIHEHLEALLFPSVIDIARCLDIFSSPFFIIHYILYTLYIYFAFFLPPHSMSTRVICLAKKLFGFSIFSNSALTFATTLFEVSRNTLDWSQCEPNILTSSATPARELFLHSDDAASANSRSIDRRGDGSFILLIRSGVSL